MNKLKNRLARKFFLQYIAAFFLWIFASLAITLLGIIFVASLTWQPGLIWDLINLVQDYFPLFYLAFLISGLLIITYLFFQRPLKYIQELTNASRQMMEEPEKNVILSDDLKVVQDQLNAIRLESLNNMAQAREANERKNNLIMYLAHDLKTPLTSVIGYLSLLHDEKDISEPTRDHYQDIALDKAYRLEELINEFFDITRFNLSAMEYDNKVIDVNRLVEQLVYEFKPILDEHGLTIETALDGKIYVNADGSKLSRVLDNILKNAVNYADTGTTIELNGKKQDHSMVMTISNHGPTIDAHKLKRIFDPFYRADASRASKTGGAGLGLAICKEIIEHYGGTIKADSINHQFILTITLPLVQPSESTAQDQ